MYQLSVKLVYPIEYNQYTVPSAHRFIGSSVQLNKFNISQISFNNFNMLIRHKKIYTNSTEINE